MSHERDNSCGHAPKIDRWCKRFDDIWTHQAQKREFRNYIGGLLGESERKNLSQMADNAVGVAYHRLHHFLTEAPWSTLEVNERRLVVMNQCSQTRISRGFTLIVDDSGHRKSGNFTEGVGRQYIGEIGKTDNGIVVVTTHLYDGKKSLPLDIELYQHSSSLPEGAKGWLGLREYQVREKRSLMRHFILVFCAYTFILWHTLTGGLRRRWANKPLNTFAEALVAFRTAMSFRFFDWLNLNRDVFAAYKDSLGFIWA